MLKRFTIGLVNVIFPPLAVMLITGPETDMIINCILFLCAIIPSHIHGFYISMTYFNRKRKVRRGRYPGDWRRGIYSERVQYGGATRNQYLKLKVQEKGSGTATERLDKRSSRIDPKRQRIEEWDDGFNEKSGNGNNRGSIYARPTVGQRSSSARNSGAYGPVTDAANIRPAVSRQSSNRRSIHDRPVQGDAPIPSRTSSRRSGDYTTKYDQVQNEEALPDLRRSSSGRRVY